MNRLSNADRVRILACLVEGNSIRATCRMTGFAKGTVLKLLADLGTVCAEYHHENVRSLRPERVEADEIWGFCYAKAKTVQRNPELQEIEGAGDVWTYTGLDSDSKLMVSWLVGEKGPDSAAEFMHDLAGRVKSRMQLTTDGNKNYYIAVPEAFGDEVDFGMLVKIYGDPNGNGKIGTTPLTCVGTKRKRIIGNPDTRKISTSYVERQNLTIRMCSRRFTRSTNAFSKKLENLCHALSVHFMFYNFCRKHQTLGKTPAQAAGLADHAWSLNELVGLLDAVETAAIEAGAMKRGPYKRASAL